MEQLKLKVSSSSFGKRNKKVGEPPLSVDSGSC